MLLPKTLCYTKFVQITTWESTASGSAFSLTERDTDVKNQRVCKGKGSGRSIPVKPEKNLMRTGGYGMAEDGKPERGHCH